MTVGEPIQTVDGFSNATVRVVDITNASEPQELSGQIEERKGGSFAVTVQVPTNGPRSLLSFTDDRIKQPVSVTANQPSSWHDKSRSADLLIITHRDFSRAVTPLKALRQQQGYGVEVIDVEASRVFDIEPLGSHGPVMVFFSGDGKALLLIGQWLLDQPAFPALKFRVRCWADTVKPIRIESRGPVIEPEQSRVAVPSTTRIRDIEIFDATPDTLEHDLTRAFK